MFRRYSAIALAIFISLGLIATPIIAAPAPIPYIQLNNGQSISITASEQPQINVQFGNRGQATLKGVFVRCTWTKFIRFTGQAQTGPFRSFQFVAGNPPRLFFPAAAPSSTQVIDLPAGQNYNVAFNIRLELPNPTTKGRGPGHFGDDR